MSVAPYSALLQTHISTPLLLCLAGLDFVFHMFFLVKYCKSLEEGEWGGAQQHQQQQHVRGKWPRECKYQQQGSTAEKMQGSSSSSCHGQTACKIASKQQLSLWPNCLQRM
jgi:hypothetical protein